MGWEDDGTTKILFGVIRLITVAVLVIARAISSCASSLAASMDWEYRSSVVVRHPPEARDAARNGALRRSHPRATQPSAAENAGAWGIPCVALEEVN